MEVDLALLADAATIDAAGKLNILGVFDRISTATFPAQHGHMVLVLRFSADIGEIGKHQVVISLRDPRGQQVAQLNGDMQLGTGRSGMSEGLKLPHVLHIDGMVFPFAGQYSFDVTVDGEHHVTVPLHVAGPASAMAKA